MILLQDSTRKYSGLEDSHVEVTNRSQRDDYVDSIP